MIDITYQEVLDGFNLYFWPFLRLLGLFMAAPLFSESGIPARVKVGLAAVFSLLIGPLIPAPNLSQSNLYEIFFLVLLQTFIGWLIGLCMRIVFSAVQTAGEFIGLQMGLSFASFFDPATGSNTAVLARFLNVVAMLLFISVDGHLFLLDVLFYSFTEIPVSLTPFSIDGIGVFLDWTRYIWFSGLLLALPLIIVLLSINLAFGILNRTAQQLTVFAVGFPITLSVGFILLVLVIPHTAPFLLELFSQGFDALRDMIWALHPSS